MGELTKHLLRFLKVKYWKVCDYSFQGNVKLLRKICNDFQD